MADGAGAIPDPPAGRDPFVRRFTLLTALRWFPVGLMVPVLILLMQARGLDLAQAGRLMALYSLAALLLELPTGGLADVLGRRPVLAGASLLSAASVALLAVAPAPAAMAVAVLGLGVGRALASGPLEAWYVDAVRRDDPGAEIGTGIAHAQAAEAVALGVGAVVGGLLPSLATRAGLVAGADGASGSPDGPLIAVIPLSVPLLAASLLLVVHALAVLVLAREPARPGARTHPAQDGAGTVAATVRTAVGLVWRAGDLRRLVGYAVLLGVALSGVELISPAAFAALLGGPQEAGAGYGPLVGLGFGAAALGAVLAPRVARRLGPPRRAAVVLSLGLVPVVLLVAVPVVAVAGPGFVGFYLVLGLNGPVLAGLLHDRVSGAQRSTVLSAESLAVQLGGVGASLAIGALVARTSTTAGYLLVGLALAVGVLLLRGLSAEPGPGAATASGSARA